MANRFLSNITINDSYTFPSADGDAGQIITTDGSGNLSFTDISNLAGAQSNFVYYDVKNSSGATINKGAAVMAVGTDGNSGHILIDEMVADGSIEPKFFMGVLESTLANGEIGRVIHFGELDQFNTNAFNDGDVLWCDPATPGGFTTTEPDGPNVKIAAAIVINSATNGKIKVRVQGNPGLHELHDVNINLVTLADGGTLYWDYNSSVWRSGNILTIDHTNERVGIGTDSPAGALDVARTSDGQNVARFRGQVRIDGADPSRLTIADKGGTENLWNFDNAGGTLRIFREDWSDDGKGTNGSVKFSITNAGNAVLSGSITAGSFIKDGGTSSQFLKADGSVDSSTYLTSESDTLQSVTDRNNVATNSIAIGRFIQLSDSADYTYISGFNSGAADGDWVMRMMGYDGSSTPSTFMGSFDIKRGDSDSGVLNFRQRINGTNTDVANFTDGIATFNYRLDAPTIHINSSASLADGTNPDISTGITYSTGKVVTPKLVFLNDAAGDDNYITCDDANTAYSVNGESMAAWYEFVGDKLAADSDNSGAIVVSGILTKEIQATNITMNGDTVLTDITVQTDPKYLRSDVDDFAAGIITFENGIRVGTGSHGTSANRATITFGEGTPTTDSMYIEYDGEGASGDNNALYIGRTDTASDLARFTYGGDIEFTSNNWSIGAGGTFTTSGSATIGGDVQINGTGGTIGNSGSIADAFLKVGNDLGFDPNQILFIGSGYINAGSDLLLSGGGLGTAGTLVLKANGNVGIGTGTTTPGAKLHVVGSTLIDSGSLSVTSASYTQISVNQTDSAAINMGVSSGSTEGFLNVINSGDNHLATSPELKLLLNSTRYATLTTTGLGIGTDNPGYKLDVEGSVNGEATLLRLNNTFDDNDPASAPLVSMFMNAASNNGYLRVYGAPANAAAKHQFDIGSTAATSFMTFSPNATERMRITAGGLVGINTNDPQAVLHIKGNSEQWIRIDSNDGDVCGIRLQSSTDSRHNVLYRDTTTNLLTLRAGTDDGEIAFIASGSANEMMRLDGTGLGIGMTSPDYKLHVYGEGEFYQPETNSNCYLRIKNNRARNAAVYTGTTNGGFYAGTSVGTDTFGYTIYDAEAGVVRTTVDSSGNFIVNGAGHIIMQEDHYVNYRFEMDAADNTGTVYILLCLYAGGNDVNGTITMDRTSGLRHAARIDILISSGSSALPVGGLRAFGTSGSGDPEYNLVTCDYSGNTYVAVEIRNPDLYYETTGAYFTGRIKSTGGFLIPKKSTEVSNVTAYENNCEHVFQGNAGFRDGNLGVGTTNPSDRLEVVGTGKFGEDADVTESAVIKLRDSGDGMIAAVRTGIRTWAHNIYADGHYAIRNVDDSTNVLTLSDDNRVGINRGDPSYTFDVNGSARIGGASTGTEFRIEATDTAGAPAATATIRMVGYEGRGIGTFYEDVSYAGEWFSGLRYNGGFGTYHIGFDGSGGQAEYSANSKLSVASDGKVLMPGTLGVGTTIPAEKLEVIGNIQAYQGAGNSAKIRLNVGNAGSPQIDMSDTAGDNYWAVGPDDADNFFKIHGSTTSMPTINSIGTGAFLTVNQSGTLTMTGDVVAYSDERLKDNVQTIDGALDKVLSMRGVYYNRNDIEDKRRKVGVIAQEVEKVLPEVVSQYSKDDDTRAVDYGKMVGVLIEAMKEQQKQIEELKAIINKK